MPFIIERNDISKMKVDVIVNSTSKNGIKRGGAEAAIIEAGGPKLHQARLNLENFEVSQAMITKGFNLQAKYVIHTVGPHYVNETSDYLYLRNTYNNVLHVARSAKCQSIAFPLISSGLFGYPKRIALQIAEEVITQFLLYNEMDIHLVVYDDESYLSSLALYNDVTQYIDDNLIYEANYNEAVNISKTAHYSPAMETANLQELENRLSCIDEGFSKTLIKLIENSRQKNSVIYTRANVDKKLFSKIKNNPDYHPSKNIAIAFAVALKLNLEETKDFIERVGYALSSAIVFDLIIEYCINKKIYNIHKINELLYDKDQPLLGSTMI